MRFSNYVVLEKKSKSFYINTLTELKEGRISVKKFLNESEKLEEIAIKNANIYTDNFDEFYDYLEKNYPNSISQAEHEKKHEFSYIYFLALHFVPPKLLIDDIIPWAGFPFPGGDGKILLESRTN